MLLLLSLNLATVKLFGEMEFWFAMIKIVAIVALIVAGFVLVAMRLHLADAAQRHGRQPVE